MTAKDELEAAQEQADEYGSFARSGRITAGSEVFTFRNPMCFTDDQLTAYQQLHHRMNQCDRWPDTEVPEQHMETSQPDGTVIKTHIGAHVRRGEYIEPYQEGGVLVDPPYEVQVARIVLGGDYDRFRKAGGSSRELVHVLAELRKVADKRVDADPKSSGSAVALAAVPDAD